MPRKLADSTLSRLRVQLEDERARLVELLDTHQREREEARLSPPGRLARMALSETAAERTPDPMTAEGGSMAFEYEKELSVDQNLEDLVKKIDAARARMDAGSYGVCASCGERIPVERLETLPHATECVTCAAKTR